MGNFVCFGYNMR